MLVRDVMSTELVTCDVDATLEDVAERMLERRVGSVIVTRADDPAGIVTETDLIRASYDAGAPVGDIPVEAGMSRPVVTIDADRTLRRATERMAAEAVKKLPVSDGIDTVGIVTLTDVVHHYSDLKREIHDLERRSWDGRVD